MELCFAQTNHEVMEFTRVRDSASELGRNYLQQKGLFFLASLSSRKHLPGRRSALLSNEIVAGVLSRFDLKVLRWSGGNWGFFDQTNPSSLFHIAGLRFRPQSTQWPSLFGTPCWKWRRGRFWVTPKWSLAFLLPLLSSCCLHIPLSLPKVSRGWWSPGWNSSSQNWQFDLKVNVEIISLEIKPQIWFSLTLALSACTSQSFCNFVSFQWIFKNKDMSFLFIFSLLCVKQNRSAAASLGFAPFTSLYGWIPAAASIKENASKASLEMPLLFEAQPNCYGEGRHFLWNLLRCLQLGVNVLLSSFTSRKWDHEKKLLFFLFLCPKGAKMQFHYCCFVDRSGPWVVIPA